MRMKMCAATHSARKMAPQVSDTFESAFWRWMNTPAKPAVTSRDAGIKPSSSRLRALTRRPRPASRRDSSLLEVHHERGRVRLRAKVVVEQLTAARRRDQ